MNHNLLLLVLILLLFFLSAVGAVQIVTTHLYYASDVGFIALISIVPMMSVVLFRGRIVISDLQ
jgi:hypothetical protein